jgi:hypothetical protein
MWATATGAARSIEHPSYGTVAGSCRALAELPGTQLPVITRAKRPRRWSQERRDSARRKGGRLRFTRREFGTCNRLPVNVANVAAHPCRLPAGSSAIDPPNSRDRLGDVERSDRGLICPDRARAPTHHGIDTPRRRTKKNELLSAVVRVWPVSVRIGSRPPLLLRQLDLGANACRWAAGSHDRAEPLFAAVKLLDHPGCSSVVVELVVGIAAPLHRRSTCSRSLCAACQVTRYGGTRAEPVKWLGDSSASAYCPVRVNTTFY